MAKKELARDRQNSPRIQKVIDALYGGHIPIDTQRAAWDDGPDDGPFFTYCNYSEGGRFESASGRIPKELLWMYSDPRYKKGGTDDGH